MNLIKLIAAAMGGLVNPYTLGQRAMFRGPTPSARKKGLIDKSGLPSGYPGAKLARRAMQKGIAVKHHGLRMDGKV